MIKNDTVMGFKYEWIKKSSIGKLFALHVLLGS